MPRFVSLIAVLTLAACGSAGDDSCVVGTAGCRCTSSGACDTGLTCNSGVCGGPGSGSTAAASSAGHQWCLRVGKGARVNAPNIVRMWAASENDAWFLTNRAMVINGVPPPYSGPGAPAPVLGVGYSPALIHWDGQTLCQTDKDFLSLDMHQSALFSIWGSSDSDIWAVGDLGSALHWDGRAWKQTTISTESDTLTAIAGNRADNVYVLADGGLGAYRSIRGGDLLHWDGLRWSPIRRNGDGINFSSHSKVWLDEDERVWMSWIEGVTDGEGGCQVLLYDGRFTCRLFDGFGSGWQYVNSVHGLGTEPWALVKETGEDRYTVWTPETLDRWRWYSVGEIIYDVKGFDDGQLWISGESGVWRWNGTDWDRPDPSSKPIGSMWGPRSDQAWGWNDRELYRTQGTTWKRIAPP